jgi:hypothetical protein
MGELDTGSGALAVQEIDDAGQRSNLLVLPQAKVAIADAAFRRHRRCLEHHQTEATNAEAPEMNEVPVIGEAVLCRILAHGRDDRAVAQGEAAQRGG